MVIKSIIGATCTCIGNFIEGEEIVMNILYRNMVVCAFVFIVTPTAEAAIINIDARNNTPQNPISIYLSSGEYEITPIGIADGGYYDAWSAGNGGRTGTWKSGYNYSSNEFGAFFVPDGALGPYYTNANEALTNAVSSTFSLMNEGIVNFYIHDGPNGSWAYDNVGGMSLEVSGVVPLPSAIWMFIGGLAVVSLLGRNTLGERQS